MTSAVKPIQGSQSSSFVAISNMLDALRLFHLMICRTGTNNLTHCQAQKKRTAAASCGSKGTGARAETFSLRLASPWKRKTSKRFNQLFNCSTKTNKLQNFSIHKLQEFRYKQPSNTISSAPTLPPLRLGAAWASRGSSSNKGGAPCARRQRARQPVGSVYVLTGYNRCRFNSQIIYQIVIQKICYDMILGLVM